MMMITVNEDNNDKTKVHTVHVPDECIFCSVPLQVYFTDELNE